MGRALTWSNIRYMGGRREDLRTKLFRRLVITEPPTDTDRLGRPLIGPCLLWQRPQKKTGYGLVYEPGTQHGLQVHRVMYEMFVGPIENELDHLCRVRHCGSPAHLEDVTHAENCQRGDSYQSLITHCPAGHPYDEANTGIKPPHPESKSGNPRRRCRACARDYYHAHK